MGYYAIDVSNEPSQLNRTAKRDAGLPVRLHTKSENCKLAPVQRLKTLTGGRRLVALRPFVMSTYLSTDVTCPSNCIFRGEGCYVEDGLTRLAIHRLNAAAVGWTADEVIASEVDQLDRAFRGRPIPLDGAQGGRDLRLHESGDVQTIGQAESLAEAAERLRRRGCGRIWTYTRAHMQVPRSAWGSAISPLASVERTDQIASARRQGYAVALLVPALPNGAQPFRVQRSLVVPCGFETDGLTCVECRLCFDDRALSDRNVIVGFAAHGRRKRQVQRRLVQMQGDLRAEKVAPGWPGMPRGRAP